MATASSPAPAPALSETQLTGLRFAATAATIALLALAAAKIVTSIGVFMTTTLLALLGLVEGGVTVLAALILIKINTDLRYAREMPQLGSLHLLNALDSWADFCKALVGIAALALLSALLRM